MRKLYEIAYMARDAVAVLRGKDYFHREQPIGLYFSDPRCYYNDMRHKAEWRGAVDRGVPLIWVPALGRTVHFPITILQFGLGSLDQWLCGGSPIDAQKVRDSVIWTLDNLQASGSLENHFVELQPEQEFYSDNSAMAQGEALSLLTRALRFGLLEGGLRDQAMEAASRIASNLLAPVELGGAALWKDNRLAFCELCRKDNQVILNGWVFALFGLRDYADFSDDQWYREAWSHSVTSLDQVVGDFLLPSGWSLYDDKGRVASPFYHSLHIALLDAVCRLANNPRNVLSVLNAFRAANTLTNRTRYAAFKAWTKLTEKTCYATTSDAGAGHPATARRAA